jgi:hypothetical protein
MPNTVFIRLTFFEIIKRGFLCRVISKSRTGVLILIEFYIPSLYSPLCFTLFMRDSEACVCELNM